MALFQKTTDILDLKGDFSWSKRRTEKPEEFDLFEQYLHSADRNPDALATRAGLQKTYIEGLVLKHMWVERATAHDFHELNKETGLDVSVISSKDVTVMEMNEKHTLIANKAQHLAVLGFTLLENFIKERNFETDDGKYRRPPLSPEDLVKLAKFGVELERTVNGQASKINETIVQNYSNLSNEQLLQLEELIKKADGESDET